MDDGEWLADRFEAHSTRLRAVAYRMLGSLSEADDALQEAWLRVSHAGISGVDNLGGWLTTVVARVCLDMLRSRTARREEPQGVRLPDPIISDHDAPDPRSGGAAHVVVRADWGGVHAGSGIVRGARDVAERALAFSRRAPNGRHALVNGTAGVVVAAGDGWPRDELQGQGRQDRGDRHPRRPRPPAATSSSGPGH